MLKDDGLIGAERLRERGWTKGLVTKFLSEPDKLVPNPRYRSAAPMKLYAIPRVEAAETTPDFLAAQATAAKRSAATTRVMDAKRAMLLTEIEAWPVEIKVLPSEHLQRLAIVHYNRRQNEQIFSDNSDRASVHSNPEFLTRITVNYARHQLTQYEHKLESLAGRVGVADGEHLVRRKVYAVIAGAYPHLADECTCQLARREMKFTM